MGAPRDDVWLTGGRELEFGEVRLAEELCLREFQIELLLLGCRQTRPRVDELPPRPFIEPLGVVSFTLTCGEYDNSRELFDSDS